MRFIVLLFAILMPVVAWMSEQGMFGPTNGEVSDRYPTLLVAAGYAFSIWGLVFLFDLVHAISQLVGAHRRDRALTLAAMPAAAGFLFTTVWMPLFSLGLFAACLVVIFAALACTVAALLCVVRHGRPGAHPWAHLALGLHAGWLSLAAFLNLAQVIVAYGWLPTDRMLGWSLVVFAATTATLFAVNRAARGHLTYVAAALWGLVAVYVRQSASDLPGADVIAWLAIAVAVALALQTLLLQRHRRDAPLPMQVDDGDAGRVGGH